MIARATVPLLAALLLAACGGGSDTAPAEDGTGGAAGEVLGGTISDEMLPLDTVRTQAPLRPPPPSEEGASAEEGAEEAADTAPTAEPAADTPASEDDAGAG